MESIIHAGSLLWAKEHLSVKDLPTFGDLLKEIDPVTLARVVVDCHDDKGMEKDSSAYLAELSKVLRSIEEMRQLGKPRCSEETVFLPKVEFGERGRNTIRYSLSLRRFKWADIPAVLEQARAVERCASIEQAKEMKLFAYPSTFTSLFEFECPWEEVLAARVWLGGDRVSAADRYEMLGSVVHHMTLLGTTYEQAKEYREALAQSRAARNSEPEREYHESKRRIPPSGLGPYGLGFLNTYVEHWDAWKTHNHFSDTKDLLDHNAWVDFYRGVQEMASHFDEFIQEAPADEGDEGEEGAEGGPTKDGAPSAAEAAAEFMDEYETAFEELAEDEEGEGCTA